MAPQSVYSFPILKVNDIMHFLRGASIQIDIEDFRSPSAPIVRRMFECFVEDITGITKEEMSTPHFSGLECLDFPELHEESVPELSFFRATQKMMTACGITDFGLKDLIDPDPKRFRRQMSGLINFTRFRSERTSAFEELMNKTHSLNAKKQAVEEEQAKLRQQLQVLRDQRAAEEPALNQLRNECGDLEDEINGLNKQQALLRSETSELKEKVHAIRDDVSTKQYAILDAQQEIERLRGLIVNSPERVKKEIRSIKSSLEGGKEEASELERKTKNSEAFLESIMNTEKEVRKISALMEDVEESMTSCTAAKLDVKEKKQFIESSKLNMDNAVTAKERLERLYQQKQEALNKLKAQAVLKIQGADEAILSAKQDLNDAQANKSTTNDRITQIEAFLKTLEGRKAEEEENHAKKVEEMTAMLTAVSTAVMNYNRSINSVIGVQN